MTAARRVLSPLFGLLALGLAACGDDAVRVQDGAVAAARQEVAGAPLREVRPVDPADAQVVLRRIDERLRPAARAVCREKGGETCSWTVAYQHVPTFNAYASGRDRVVMFGGVFGVARNEAEIAMVLAHEKAHHILNHVAETSRNAGIGAFVVDILVVVGAQWLAEALGLPLPAALVDGIRRTAAGAGAQAGVLAFSVENEKEADALAAEIMRRAGYDPHDARGMLLAMGAMGRGDATPGFLRTHPAGPERLAHWDAVVAAGARDRARLPRPAQAGAT